VRICGADHKTGRSARRGRGGRVCAERPRESPRGVCLLRSVVEFDQTIRDAHREATAKRRSERSRGTKGRRERKGRPSGGEPRRG